MGPTLRARITLSSAAFKKGAAKTRTIATKLGESLIKKFKKIGSAMAKGIKYGLVGISAAAGASLAAVAAYGNKIMETGDDLDKMSARTGVAVDELSRLGHAADLASTDLNQVEDALKDMQKNVTDAGLGSAGMVENLKLLGLTAEELQKQTPDEQFKTLAARIDGLSDPSEKATIAMRIFGEGGRKLLPMFKDLKGAMSDADGLGKVFSKEDAKQAADMSTAIGRAKDSIFGLFKSTIGFKKLTILVDKITASIVKFRKSSTFKKIREGLQKFGAKAARVAYTVVGAFEKMYEKKEVLLGLGAAIGAGITALVSILQASVPMLAATAALVVNSGIIAPLVGGFAMVAGIIAGFKVTDWIADKFDMQVVRQVVTRHIKDFFADIGSLLGYQMQALISSTYSQDDAMQDLGKELAERDQKRKDDLAAAMDLIAAQSEAALKDLKKKLGIDKAEDALKDIKKAMLEAQTEFDKIVNKPREQVNAKTDGAIKGLKELQRELNKTGQVKFQISNFDKFKKALFKRLGTQNQRDAEEGRQISTLGKTRSENLGKGGFGSRTFNSRRRQGLSARQRMDIQRESRKLDNARKFRKPRNLVNKVTAMNTKNLEKVIQKGNEIAGEMLSVLKQNKSTFGSV